MKPTAALTALAVILLTSSCNKHNVLMGEKAKVEAEIAKKNQEIQTMDATLHSYGMDPVAAKIGLDRQTASLAATNQLLEKQLSDMTRRCAEGEATVESLRARVDAYKAKHFR
ncbi:MAG: hypothetical protein IAE77_21800 [Prosthecobacter sp.]|jgi:hypothetical protein|uniref:hypothetical protein n=1 Tax=Prosthecobacter sp. TaxID=1965333 RepID=UPI001A089636|nr:hypothetical protein [Prosthecobacter sp.]MBE2286105.1 hypothetical protein [Prosthecobacter sp.]